MNSITNSEKIHSKKYNVVEYATPSLFKRHQFKTNNEDVEPQQEEELYRSHFLHSKEIKDYFRTNKNIDGKNTISGYDGSVFLDYFILDIDDEDNLQRALSNTRKLLRSLEQNYEIDLASLKINFSGYKGFHVRIPGVLFGGFEPSEKLNEVARSIALRLSDGIVNLDTSVFDKTRLMRVINSFNKKSSLYAIPLTPNEIFSLSIDEIKEMAVQQREITFTDADEYESINRLVELKNECSSISNVKENIKKITHALEPQSSGERHDSLAMLVGKLISAGIKDDDIKNICHHWNQQNLPPKEPEVFEKEVSDLLMRYGNIEGDFWKIKRGKNGINVKVMLYKFINYLNENGIGKIQLGKNYLFIKEEDKLISEYSDTEIKDMVINEIDATIKDNFVKQILIEDLYQHVSKYFKKDLLETVKSIDLLLLRDTKYESFLFYENGIVEVSKKNGVIIHEYKWLEKPIWKDQILKREYSSIKKVKQSVYEKFLWKVVKGDEDRMLAICSSIGYLMHRYKDKNNPRAIVLMDEKVTDVPFGRTGKSLFGKALSYVRNSVRIDGKNYEFNNNAPFQDVSPQTEILEFNDVKKNFDFERLFSVLTDDMRVRYLYDKPYILKFEESPKIMLSTNFSINGIGDSYEARLFEIEFSDYYNARHQPKDDFHHIFFDDWNDEEWNRFDNFIVECIELYLEYGLVEYKRKNILQKKLLNSTSPEFVDFMSMDVANRNYEKDKENFYNDFKRLLGHENDLFGKCPVKKNTFTRWLKIYTEYSGLKYEERKSDGKVYVKLS
jgi:hypothetical protein